jgi:hypothetical protein
MEVRKWLTRKAPKSSALPDVDSGPKQIFLVKTIVGNGLSAYTRMAMEDLDVMGKTKKHIG